MKIQSVCTIAMLCTVFTETLLAANSLPPAGPYRSLIETNTQDSIAGQNDSTMQPSNSYPEKYDQRQQARSLQAPDWVIKQQAEMQALIQQQKTQMQEWQRQVHEQQQQRNTVPEWARQQQAQLELLARQMNQSLPTQDRQQEQSSHSINNNSEHNNSGSQEVNKASPDDRPMQNNINSYFPSARGPIYGPNMPPPHLYQRPGYPSQAHPAMQPPGNFQGSHFPGAQIPAQQYRNTYPPVWR